MSIFDKFKKKQENIGDNNKEINTQGWDAITAECERVYPNQKNPKHYGTLVNWKFGGNDPLEGISIYEEEITYIL